MTMPLTFGCSIPHRGTLATPQTLRIVATHAEELGFDHLWVGDHIVLPTQIASTYPYALSGIAPFDPEQPYCEPLALLSYLAASTHHIKLGTHVLILPYREPIFTAKIISTLDYLSEGRVILGVGAGWMQEEFAALGRDTFKQRGAVTDEHIRIFKELWTADDPQFQGAHYQFSGFKFSPKPAQRPHPPIWIGGHTHAAIKRAATLGDGWIPIGLRPPAQLEPEEMAGLIRRLRDMTEAANRPREAVEVAFSTNLDFRPPDDVPRRTLTGAPEQIASDIARYREVGVGHFVFAFESSELDRVLEDMERFAKEVRPRIAG